MKKMETTDMNGNVLENGDSVIFTKSMKVKGTQIHLKKGTKVKNIRLTDNLMEIDGKWMEHVWFSRQLLLGRNKRIFFNFGIAITFLIL